MLSVFWAVLRRDLLLAFRQRGVLVHHLLFFVLVVALFPLGTGADAAILVTVSPALIWMAVLLAALLSLQRLFKPDYEDGTLEQYVLSPEPLALIALAKVLAYWLASGLIFVLASPLLVLLLGVPASAVPVIMASLLLGTPTLGLVGAIGTALTLSLPRAGLLLSLLIFPLYVPILIFGAGAMRAAIAGLPAAGALYLLGALLVLGITTAPFAIAAALKISLE
ncbi:heme exporter protein CcmB [Salinisphaera shabanensis T35B1]|uniref:Heme exporter protein B n=1 Tax=Salinisphaera shabanensis E1L3A TaxID=1033802 RepID=F7QBL7_9GAMM|nr:heme exporter protein CcmB [Salinisphaera shabanensis]ERJ18515.1 Heme exporter protein B [Salinisphaera shabanensis E1L3A]